MAGFESLLQALELLQVESHTLSNID